MIESYKKIASEAARKVLSENKITSAPVDVRSIIEKMGIEYIETTEIDFSVSGFIKRSGKNGRPVIVVNKNHVPERRRFTAAHELGHFLLHSTNEVFVDTNEEKILYRRSKNDSLIDLREIQANNFAGELLIPKDILIKDIGSEIATDEESLEKLVEKLAKQYQVSSQSMTIRLGSLLC